MPKLVLDEEAVETLLALSQVNRRRILAVLDQLRHSHPHDSEDFSETDETGRHVSVKAIRPVLITYWLDAPVNELRITCIKHVQPWKR